jgi:hypothetical protein
MTVTCGAGKLGAEMGGEAGVELDGDDVGAGGEGWVMAPAPGPISTTVRPERSPRELAMRWMACASLRKFCPSLGLEGMGRGRRIVPAGRGWARA